MLDLNKYVVNPDPGKPLHSNGFAVVANSGHVGSSSSVSFYDRQKIAHGRRAIQSYSRSMLIGQTYDVKRANAIKPNDTVNQADSHLSSSPVLPSKRSFQEPSSGRSYNPYT